MSAYTVRLSGAHTYQKVVEIDDSAGVMPAQDIINAAAADADIQTQLAQSSLQGIYVASARASYGSKRVFFNTVQS